MTKNTSLLQALFGALPINAALVNQLTDSIRAIGQQVPITRVRGVVVDGRHRELACKAAGVTPIYHDLDDAALAPFEGTDAPGELYMAHNLVRQHWSLNERALLGAAYAQFAKGDNQHSAGFSRKALSELLGVSQDSIDRSKKVLDSGNAELIAQVKSGERSPSSAAREIAAVPLQSKTARVSAPDPLDAFLQSGLQADILFINAARVSYQNRMKERSWGGAKVDSIDANFFRAHEFGAIAAPNSMCALWTPAAHFAEGIDLLQRWGFPKLRCPIVWKWKHHADTSGFCVRQEHGMILIGERGVGLPALNEQLPAPSYIAVKSEQNARLATSPGASQFAQELTRMFPTLTKVELFARKARPGWTCFGADDQKVELAAAA